MNKWIISITVMLPTLIEIIDTSVVNVSLDHIRGSLSAGIDESTWTITSYLVSNAIIIPITGWLSRLFGRKRYLIFSIALFTISSFLCGSAWNLKALDGFVTIYRLPRLPFSIRLSMARFFLHAAASASSTLPI